MKKTYLISNIDYDLDDVDVKLPSSIETEIEVCEGMDIDEVLGNIISDLTGFCVNSFNYKEVNRKEEEND